MKTNLILALAPIGYITYTGAIILCADYLKFCG